jgi:hypothetical protein
MPPPPPSSPNINGAGAIWLREMPHSQAPVFQMRICTMPDGAAWRRTKPNAKHDLAPRSTHIHVTPPRNRL